MPYHLSLYGIERDIQHLLGKLRMLLYEPFKTGPRNPTGDVSQERQEFDPKVTGDLGMTYARHDFPGHPDIFVIHSGDICAEDNPEDYRRVQPSKKDN